MNEKQALKLFQQADWPQITLKLTKYALFKVRRLEWSTGDFLPKGLTPEDLVLEAVRKTYEGLMAEPVVKLRKGIRSWSPEKEPDLLEFLKSVIDSDVHALVESLEHKATNYSGDVAPEMAAAGAMHAIDRVLRSETAEDTMLRGEAALEAEEDYRKLMEKLYRLCGDDEQEMLILMAYQEAARSGEKVKPALVARYAGLDEKSARNAMRRIARHVEREKRR